MAVEVGSAGLESVLVFTPLPKYPELFSAYREPESR